MGARLKSNDDALEEMSEINVTPFIDVMLVLLIIFMVAAPLATVDISVDLPSSQAQSQPKPDKPVYLTLKADLTLALGDTYIDSAQLTAELDKLTKSNKQERIFLRADESVDYGDLMGVMNKLRIGGYLKVALVGLDDLGASKAQP